MFPFVRGITSLIRTAVTAISPGSGFADVRVCVPVEDPSQRGEGASAVGNDDRADLADGAEQRPSD